MENCEEMDGKIDRKSLINRGKGIGGKGNNDWMDAKKGITQRVRHIIYR